MKKSLILTCLLCAFSQPIFAQAIYGVFSLPPTNNFGEKQIGNISPTSGDISLLGTNTSIEDGRIDMTTGATALNVTDSKSYFIGEDNSDDPVLVDRIYTVDLLTGITDSSPALSIGYTTSTNFGIWYDDIDDILYGLFLVDSITAELASIDPSTGIVTTVIADVVGEEVESLASGLMTGGRDNTNGADAKRIFTFINDSLFAIDLDNTQSIMIEIGGASFASNRTFGLEWDNINNALWILYNPDLGERNLAKVLSEDDFTEEAFVDSDFGVDGTDPITTSSGLSALDEQSGLFFFIGRPSVGANTNKWSLYTVDVNAQTSSNVDIEDAALVQTNGYAGIEVLPGPDMTFTKSDGSVTDKIPGDTITYTLSYSNDANAGATNGLTLTETVPAETTYNATASTAGWVCADVVAGSSCVFSPADVQPSGSGSVDFAVTVDSMVSTGLVSISNSAIMAATNIVTDLIASDTTPINAAPVLAVTKTDNDLLDAVPGDTIAYDITANNNGNRVASNAVLSETIPANTTYIPTVPYTWTCVPDNTAGSSCTTTPLDLADSSFDTKFHVQVDASVPAGTTEIQNTVELSADNSVTSVFTIDITPITSAAVLSISKSDADTTITPGSSVIYQIDYGNTGNQDADTTTLSEVVLNETVFNTTLSTPGWNCSPNIAAGSTCTFDIGTLGGGSSASVDFALTLNTPVPGVFPDLFNTVIIDATNADSNSAQETTTVDASVELRIVKTDGEVTAGLGKIINYTLINFNDGDQNALDVQLTETVPDNTTFYPPSSTAGWNCVPDNTSGSNCSFAVGDLNGLGGKDTTFFAVRVNNSLDPGVTELSNTASINASNTSSIDEDTELTPVDQVIPSVTLIDANPSITEITSCSQNDAQINEIVVSFQDDNPGLIGVDNVANYALIDTGPDQDLQTMSCSSLLGDDVMVNVNALTPGGTATNPNATLTLDSPLNDGQYVLLICDDITDAAGNAIDGDNNGLTGGNLNRQFRVETDNLFANAYLDDCADAPIALLPWQITTFNSDVIDVIDSIDRDDSSLSGSILMDSKEGFPMGIRQCINFDEIKSHAISVDIIGLASQNGDVELQLICQFSGQANCTQINDDSSKTFIMSPTVTPVWTHYEHIMLLPDGTQSAICNVSLLHSVFETPYTMIVDEMKVRDSDLIYANGFESD